MSIKQNQIQTAPIAIQEGAQPATGANKGAFYPFDASGVTEAFYADNLGRAIQLTRGGEAIVPDSFSGENITAAGSQVFKERTGNKLRFRRIVAGSNVTVTENDDNITIASTGGGGGGSGEANTGSNVGAGSQVFKQKSGVSLQFRTLVAGTNVTLTQGTDTITIAASGGGGGSGETNTASNVGTGAGLIFKQKNGVDLEFKKVAAGAGITVTNGASDVTIATTAEANTASNSSSGTGAGTIFKAKAGVDLVFKKILAGANVTVTNGADDITIAATGGGSGETNTASNSSSGTGTGTLFKTKTGVDLVFKKLKAGTGIALTNGTDDVTIAATGGGGGHETQILSFDSGNVVVKATGSTADLATVTADKSFAASGASTLVLNKPTTVTYHSVNVTFTSAETTGRTEVRLECPDMNGATSESKATRVFAIRINASYGVAATASTFVFVSGTTFRTTLTGYTAAQEQKAVFQF